MSYIIVAVLACLLFFAGNVSERNAIGRRAKRLADRQPISAEEWTQSISSVDRKTIEILLPLIGTGLNIPHQYLQPSDSFDAELNLKDRFWCLIADDDSQESIADVFEDRYNERPSGEWANLREVVLETSSIAQRTDG